MKKLALPRRAPRRRWLVAIVSGAVLSIVGMVGFALPAFANHVGNLTGNCTEVVVTWVDFESQSVPVHIAIQVPGVGSTAADVNVDENTPPTHVNVQGLTSQLNGQPGTVVVDVTWHLDTDHHEHGSFPVTCGTGSTTSSSVSPSSTAASTSTSTSSTSSSTTTSTVPVTVTTGGGTESTSTSTASSTTTSSIAGISVGQTPGGGGTSEVEALSATNSSLPFTGSASLPLIVIGLALLIGGAAAVIVPRRRASRTS